MPMHLPTPMTKVTVSAGGVVINNQGMVLVTDQHGTSWSLPKGHVDPGEDALEAAIREIHEESGVSDLKLIEILGSYGRYKLSQNNSDDKSEWKVMIFFLFKTNQNELKPIDPHNPQARWVRPNEVEGLLTHPKDKQFFKSIISRIK